jgi:hypothetical protein
MSEVTTMRGMRIHWLMAAVLGAASPASFAQDQQRPAETPRPAEQEAAPPSAPPQGGARRAPAPRDDVFVPTEELSADEEVTFPVDI